MLLVLAPAAARARDPVSVRLTRGNPGDATTSTRDRDNFLTVKPQLVLSYDGTEGGAN